MTLFLSTFNSRIKWGIETKLGETGQLHTRVKIQRRVGMQMMIKLNNKVNIKQNRLPAGMAFHVLFQFLTLK